MNVFASLRKPKPVDEGKLALLRERGARAKRLLNDETLVEALARMEAVYMAGWLGSAALDVELRERAHISVNLIHDLKKQLLSFATDGEMAAKKLEAELNKKN